MRKARRRRSSRDSTRDVNAFAIEPTTGEFAIAGQDDRTDISRCGPYFYGGGAITVLGLARADNNPAGPLSGMDVAPDPVEYGTESGTAQITWADVPDPRRLPIAGQSFHAVLDWPAGVTPNANFVTFGAAAGSIALGGYELLLDPADILPILIPMSRDWDNRQSIGRSRWCLRPRA